MSTTAAVADVWEVVGGRPPTHVHRHIGALHPYFHTNGVHVPDPMPPCFVLRLQRAHSDEMLIRMLGAAAKADRVATRQDKPKLPANVRRQMRRAGIRIEGKTQR